MAESSAAQADIALLAERIAAVKEVADRIIADGNAASVPADDVAQPLYIAARLLSAQTDIAGTRVEWPIGENALNATDTVVLVTALLEAADVNLFDMAIWYRRV